MIPLGWGALRQLKMGFAKQFFVRDNVGHWMCACALVLSRVRVGKENGVSFLSQ